MGMGSTYLRDLEHRLSKLEEHDEEQILTSTLARIYSFIKGNQDGLALWLDRRAPFDQARAIRTFASSVSESDPFNPEFPRQAPLFPATPTIPIEAKGFCLFVKDESYNRRSGTHKDRLGWEVAKAFAKAVEDDRDAGREPRCLSILSAGSAATAIQRELQGPTGLALPPLRVLVDEATNPRMIDSLRADGCEVFTSPLEPKDLDSRDILRLTNNPSGIDLTLGTGPDLERITEDYYDWMAFEILNTNPDYCFIPVGSADLFRKTLRTLKEQLSADTKDPRWRGDTERLSQCVFYGACCRNEQDKDEFDKLYHAQPHHLDRIMDEFRGVCGSGSGLVEVDPRFTQEAMMVAASNGILAEPSGIAGLHLFLGLFGTIRADARVLVVNTGRLIPHDEREMSREQRLNRMRMEMEARPARVR